MTPCLLSGSASSGVGQKIDDDLLHVLRISRQGRQSLRKTDLQAIRAVLDQMGEQA